MSAAGGRLSTARTLLTRTSKEGSLLEELAAPGIWITSMSTIDEDPHHFRIEFG